MTVEERIETMHGWANESRLILYNLEDDIDTTYLDIFSGFWRNQVKAAIDSLRSVLADHIEASQWFVYGQTSSFNYSYWRSLHLELVNVAGDVTWQQIVEAWVKDDFEGRAMTIATIDRMRQILWDEPFSVQWAARPEDQDI